MEMKVLNEIVNLCVGVPRQERKIYLIIIYLKPFALRTEAKFIISYPEKVPCGSMQQRAIFDFRLRGEIFR